MHSTSDEALDHILQYMGRSCKQETEKCSNASTSLSFKYLKPIETIASMHERFMKLPALESPTFQSSVSPTCNSQESYMQDTVAAVVNMDQNYNSGDGITDWAAMDRLVASHLNGQADPAKHELACFDEPNFNFYPTSRLLLSSGADECTRGASDITSNTGGDGCDGDLWSFAMSASSDNTFDPNLNQDIIQSEFNCGKGGGEAEVVLTVWRKSLLFNGHGFTVFDPKGNLLFRVDNYASESRGEIVLMDANSKPLLTIKPLSERTL
ncbi:NAC domain-containing protein 43-like protein [Carex littledalei]|uniref:NAC domain-containing protein 43-like protein n=1 Tax=Carex littledalei TaxID=544730 RepID=A0A833RCU8_9POAL|nr:NAC domain-containing protein 43-like protein [Carex littledalei]